MAKIDIRKIKELRELTFAGINDCKEALEACGGNISEAVKYLKKKGVTKAISKASRPTGEGIIASYVHTNDKLGVLVEVRCETDFVARSEVFREFVKNVALQIAGMSPIYISMEDVPEEVVKEWKSEIREGASDVEIKGRIQAKYKEVCLLEQPFFKDEKVTIKEMLTELIAKTGENCKIVRFVWFSLGQPIVVAVSKDIK